MITILDPLGSPVITYNKSGRNIQNLVANSGSSFGDAVSISHVSEFTVLIIDGSGGMGSGAISFSSDFEIGDIIAIYYNGSGLTIYSSDDSLVIGVISSTGGQQFVKYGSATTNWRPISG